jgi:hypothetical protein
VVRTGFEKSEVGRGEFFLIEKQVQTPVGGIGTVVSVADDANQFLFGGGLSVGFQGNRLVIACKHITRRRFASRAGQYRFFLGLGRFVVVIVMRCTAQQCRVVTRFFVAMQRRFLKTETAIAKLPVVGVECAWSAGYLPKRRALRPKTQSAVIRMDRKVGLAFRLNHLRKEQNLVLKKSAEQQASFHKNHCI